MTYSKNLYIHFVTNFSFYTLKSFLVLYISQTIGLDTAQSLLLFGNVMGLSYFLPLWMATIADRYFSNVFAIALSLGLLILGYVLIPLLSGSFKLIGFSLICIAAGFYKPCLLSEISRTRDESSKRATTLYYLACNLSGFLSGLTAGFILSFFKLDSIFFLFAGLFLHPFYLACRQTSPIDFIGKDVKIGLAVTGLIGLILTGAFFVPGILKMILPFALLITMSVILSQGLRQEVLTGVNGFYILFALISFTLFAMFFEVFGGATTLFIEHHLNRVLWEGVTIPTPFFHSLNPVLIILLGSAALLTRFKDKFLSYSSQFGYGFLGVALTVGLLAICVKAPPYLHIAIMGFSITFQAIAELMIVPKTLEILGKHAHSTYKNRIMSLWMGCISGGHLLASQISGEVLGSAPPSLDEFGRFFTLLSLVALSIGLILLVIHTLKRRTEKPCGIT